MNQKDYAVNEGKCYEHTGMTAYQHQDFPKVKYHPAHGNRTVQNAEEEKALGRGWFNTPNDFPKPSRASLAFRHAKAWCSEWETPIKVVGLILTGVLAVVALYKAIRGKP